MTKNFHYKNLLGSLSGHWLLLPSIVYLSIFFLLPVCILLSLSFIDGNKNLSLLNYTRIISTPVYVKVLLITLKTAAWTTIFCVCCGYPIAYLLATINKSTKNTLIILVLMPFWTSFLVRAFAWIVLLGTKGAINQWLLALGLVEVPVKMIFNFAGVLVGMVHALMPLCILTMYSVMENIDPNLVKAAATLGGRGGPSFWRIYFPLSFPGVAAGGLMVFITSLGFFVTPALLGGSRDTMIAQLIIFQIQEVLDWGFAGAVGVLLLITVLVIFFLYDRSVGISSLSGQNSLHSRGKSKWNNPIYILFNFLGKLFILALSIICDKCGNFWDILVRKSANKPPKTISRHLLWIVALSFIMFLALPALFIVPISFTSEGFLSWPPKGFSIKWYKEVLASPVWSMAVLRSFLVASSSAFIGMCLGVPAAFVLGRRHFLGKGAVFAFLISPIIIPHIFIAVSLFYLFSKINLVGTSFALVIGHSVLTIPYVIITVLAVIKNYDRRLDLAAWTLGAHRLQAFWHVTLPIIRAGLFSAFMFAFIISFDELTISLFLTGGELTTLPKQMWDDAILSVSPVLAAIATLLLAFMSCLILISEIIRRRMEKRK
ncbi:MAG: ABC transporter permease subunit [Thermodesulfobacteriota bacterium]